jgi:DNA-binding response OmpR family regulator
MGAAGSTVSRENLVSDVLGRDFSPFDRSIDTHVCNLRRKLGPLEDGGERIKGVRGAGYFYAAPAKPGIK